MKRKYLNKETPLIDKVVNELKKLPATKWNDDGNSIKSTIPNGGKIKIMFPSSTDGDFEIDTDIKGIQWIELIKKKLNQKITEEDVTKSIFNVPLSYATTGNLFLLDKNIDVFKELETYFKSMGFKQVGCSDKPVIKFDPFFCDNLTLIIAPYSGYGVCYNVTSSYKSKYQGLEGYKDPSYSGVKITKVGDEKNKIIKLNGYEIGRYYEDRNLVMLYINPFANVDLKNVNSFKENKFLESITADITQAIKDVKIKTVNNKDFKIKLMISNFNKSSKERIKTINAEIKNCENNIEKYEPALTNWYTSIGNFNNELKSLMVVEKDAVNNFLKELAKTKKASIVDDITTDNGTLNIIFKETTIKVKMDRNVEGKANGKIIEMYIGKITTHLHGGGLITLSCDYPCESGSNKNPHPHCNDNNKPCLGSGDGPSLMHKLIGQRKFSDFVWVFWMWIKKWRPEDCYVKPYFYFDDRLSKGLPIFDQKGKRICIDDKELLKDETMIKVKKHKDYDKNLKKFKNYKSQK